jgi:uncharacterized protein
MDDQLYLFVAVVAVSFFICCFLLVATLKAFAHFRLTLNERKARRKLFALRLAAANLRFKAEESKVKYTWKGYRKFVIAKKQIEANNICSFYLRPHDNRAIPNAEPGQFLTFKLNIPSEKKPVIRCYSLSDSTLNKDYYRVTIKKIPPPRDNPEAPPGLSSSFFHEQLNENDLLDVKVPSGHFYLEPGKINGVVLIGGGIGLTPVLSMLNYLIDTGANNEIWFFYGMISGQDFAMQEHLAAIKAKNHENIRIVIVMSNPGDADVEGVDYDHSGHVSVELFNKVLPSSNYDYYLCGPPPMMNAITSDLYEWGVPETRVHFEAFGPASVKKVTKPGGGEAKSVSVTFKKSGKTLDWSSDLSLLELAEEHDVPMEFGCRAGSCGTCKVAVIDGGVDYPIKPDFDIELGCCLTCLAKPKGNITIDA